MPDLVKHAQGEGWDVCVIGTRMGLRFLDADLLRDLAGRPVRDDYKRPDEPDVLPDADAFVVAPATFNTTNKVVPYQATFAPSVWLPLPGGVPVATIAAVTITSAVRGARVSGSAASRPGGLFEHRHSGLQLAEDHSHVVDESPQIR